jgi:cell division protein FtsL
MTRVPQQHLNPHLRRERDARAARRLLWLLAGCLVLAVGFVAAVRYQIRAVEYGYRTEALRREHDQLLDEQRRLQVELHKSLAPGRLEPAARELGMQPARAAQLGAAPRGESEPASAPAFVGASAAGAVMRGR